MLSRYGFGGYGERPLRTWVVEVADDSPPTLDAAIKRGEIAQCPHCHTYWVASLHQHECIGMVRARAERAEALLMEAQRFLADCANEEIDCPPGLWDRIDVALGEK
jgi:hypothetical protein